MDVRTGKIHEGDFQELKKKFNEKDEMKNLIAVSEAQMTEKQKKERKVSIHDNKSKLGKKLQEKRKKLGYSQMSRNQKRNLRKRLNK